MSVRKYPWKYKPTQLDEQLMDEALRSQLYMVSEIGPTQFLIKGEDSPAKFKVTLGDPQSCSGCTSKRASSGGKSPDLCVHLFFVMLKVLRLARNNSLVWQASLLDTEITNVLSQRYQRIEERAARRRMQAAGAGDTAAAAASAAASSSSIAADSSVAAATAVSSKGKGEPGTFRVPKRELDPDDVCPICQDELVDPTSDAGAALREAAPPGAPPLLNLVYCQWSCGQQLHAKCMRVWAEHQLANAGSREKLLACPMCRGPWSGSDPAHQLSNEQMVRELKIKEHEKIALPTPASASVEQKKDGDTSTALVPLRQPRSSPSSLAASRAAVKCCSCRKVLLLSEGRFMRCVHCSDDYNLCRVCFIRSKGIGGGSVPTPLLTNRSNHVHCFVEAKPSAHPAVATEEKAASPTSAASATAAAAAAAEFPYAYGVDWLPAPVKAPPLSSQLALTLQSRELTHGDYELLLGLDENIRNNGRPMMHAFLCRTLAVPSIRSGAPCVLCEGAILASQPLRVLPCFHQAHESCLQSQLMYDLQLRCPGDDVAIFPGLAFREVKSLARKKKPSGEQVDAQALADAHRAGALQVQASSLMFGLSGTGFAGGSVGNSGIAGTRALPNESASPAEESSSSLAIVATGSHSGAASRSVSHSHHFQLTPSALPAGATQTLREQRAAAAAAAPPTGKLRTGTAAFALPSAPGSGSGTTASFGAHDASRGDSNLFSAPLQLSGSSTLAGHAGSAPTAAHTHASIRRGRPSDDRSAAHAPSFSSSSFTVVPRGTASIGSLSIEAGAILNAGGGSASASAAASASPSPSPSPSASPGGGRSSGKAASRPRGPGHSSMFAPSHAHSLSASPTRSPSAPDSLADMSVGGSGANHAQRALTGSPPPPPSNGVHVTNKPAARPRVGRAALASSPSSSSDREPAPPLSRMLVGSAGGGGGGGGGGQGRSSSATTVRPSAAFASPAHTKPPRTHAHTHAASSADFSELSLGSATGSLLGGTGGSARSSATAVGSTANRLRRAGGLGASHAPALAAAEARAEQAAWSASASRMELAPGVSSFARPSALPAGDDAAAAGGPSASESRARASSASHAPRRSAHASASTRSAAAGSPSASPPPTGSTTASALAGSFALSGSAFSALDRGENAGSAAAHAPTAVLRSSASAGGKLRRGRTAISSGSPATAL